MRTTTDRTGGPPVQVQCLDRAVPSDRLGMTLFHEHIFSDNRGRAPRPDRGDREAWELWNAPMEPRLAARLRVDPMACLDNCVLEDVSEAVDELGYFVRAGGSTIVDQTPIGAGRSLPQLARVADATGLNIVAGTGYYLETMHPQELRSLSVQQIGERMIGDLTVGEGGLRCGLIGEIGISADFTAAEKLVLRAAGMAQSATGVPLSVHLPGWHRYGHRVLDCLEEEGVPPECVVLSHMNPSAGDVDYHLSLAERGASLSFDMIGIDWYFAQTGFQAPSDMAVAEAVVEVWRAGFGSRILLSGDTFLKMQLRRYGGPGYDHTPARFLPRLIRLGMDAAEVDDLVRKNPGCVFERASRVGEPRRVRA